MAEFTTPEEDAVLAETRAIIETEARRWWEGTAAVEQATAIADGEWQRWHGLDLG